MFFIILTLFIMILGLYNYKKGFIVYIVYQIFWLYGGSFISIGGKTITHSMGLTLYFLLLYLFKNARNKKNVNNRYIKFPYKIPFILLVFSALITPFYAVAGFNAEITRAISNILQDIVIIWLIWRVIEERNDFKLLYKYVTIIMFFACLYGIIEYILLDNPLLNYKNELMNGNIGLYSIESGRGYRICSFWEHPIGAGMCFSLYFVITLYLYIKRYKVMPNKYLAVFTALLCVPCVLLTKMRSALLLIIIGSIVFIDLRKRRFLVMSIVAVMFIVVAIPILGEYADIFLSLFNLDKLVSYSSTGSSLVQRVLQFEAVYQLMLMSPIGGLGELFKEYVVNNYTVAALSYESIWLEQMAKHGMVGVIANSVLMIYSLIIVPTKFRNKECFIISLSYWVIYTLTSIPSFRNVFYYIILFYFIKNTYVYKKNDRITGDELWITGCEKTLERCE